jgi:basic membrane protein A
MESKTVHIRRRRGRKRILSAISAVVGCCLSAFADPATQRSSVSKAALVFANGGLGDGSFNDQTWAGLQRAGTNFHVPVEYHEPGNPPNRDTVLTQVANSDADMIIAAGTMFSNIVTSLAAEHTTKSFVCLDYAGSDPLPPNLSGLSFREHEGAFLVGMIAALKSQTGAVGFVGASPIPLIRRYQAGYIQGARYAVPGTRVIVKFADAGDGGFDNPAVGTTLANAMMDEGADVIFAAAGSTGLGVFQAAEDRNRMAIGVDQDQSDLAAPGVIITSMLKKSDVLIYDIIEKTTSGTFPQGLQNYGLAEGTLDYVSDPSILSQVIRDKVEAAKADIITGELVVESTPGNYAAARDWSLFY